MTVRIAPQTLEKAPESVQKLFHGLKTAFGRVPALFATIGQSGPALEGYLAFSTSLGKSTLSAREKEQINLLVSDLNGCGYCLSAHTALAEMAHMSSESILDARHAVGGTKREQAILDLVRKLVRTGGAGSQAEVARVKEAGVSDAEIIDIIGFIASKQFTNAVAIVAGTEIDFPKAPFLPES